MEWITSIKDSIGNKIKKFVHGTFENVRRKKNHVLSTYKDKPKIKDLLGSMTTYQPRVSFFEYSILSVLNGSLLPEKILVYVPKGFKDLLHKHGSILSDVYDSGYVELIEMPEDVFCHSKYYYAFQEYGEKKDIVLFDDDVIYYKDWLSELYSKSQEYPDHNVFSYKAVEVKTNNGQIEPYDNWVHCSKISKSSNDSLLYVEAVGGAFYRRNSMRKETLNKDKFLEIATKADDVWLWFCSYLNKNKVKFILPRNGARLLYTIPNSQESALWRDNILAKINDKYVLDCHNYFKEKYGLDITKR
ncbi:MAG: hypothetical protein LBS25_06175 [Candidatus Symbiothrix sp.]|jgi:hypothetical protein|nr:hypothetical protein [Candidatus Symbiothrix sp.]